MLLLNRDSSVSLKPSYLNNEYEQLFDPILLKQNPLEVD
jgi:hypothetical protein